MSDAIDDDIPFSVSVRKWSPWKIVCGGFGSFAIIVLLIALGLPPVRAREAARRSQCKNNLKQIGLALQNYADANGGKFPPAYTVDATGKRLHSWRTLILPYLQDIPPWYSKLDFSKPWDDPANAELLKARVPVYQCPSSIHLDRTAYMAVVGEIGAFHPTQPRSSSEFTDNQSTTIRVVEVDMDHAVPWASPQDADEALILSQTPKSKLDHAPGFHVLLVDGSIRFVNAETSAAQRRALMSINGHDDPGEF